MLHAPRAAWVRRKAWLCALLALAPLSCASLENESQNESLEGIKVTNLPIVSHPIAWIDDERILLRQNTGKVITRPNGGQRMVFHLTSYNYKTGERHDYGRVGQLICYDGGYISHTRVDDENDNDIIAAFGELGKETIRRVRRGELSFERGSRGSCRPWGEHPPKPRWADKSTTVWTLWPRFGVLDCRVRDVSVLTDKTKARFHRPGDPVGVLLPFSCYEVFNGLRYYPFKGAYFALEWDYRSPWPQGRNRRVFWLYPDGRVEIATLPYSLAIRYYAIPVANGFLAFSEPSNRGDDYWVYFLTADSSRRLFRGHATGLTSPDGCKVAMIIDPDFDARVSSGKVTHPVQLKVLDFCKSQ